MTGKKHETGQYKGFVYKAQGACLECSWLPMPTPMRARQSVVDWQLPRWRHSSAPTLFVHRVGRGAPCRTWRLKQPQGQKGWSWVAAALHAPLPQIPIKVFSEEGGVIAVLLLLPLPAVLPHLLLPQVIHHPAQVLNGQAGAAVH